MSTDFQFNSNENHDASTGPPDRPFVDRRTASELPRARGVERRQFSDRHDNISADAGELGRSIDQYKLVNRRRYVSYEELLSIIQSLGYRKS